MLWKYLMKIQLNIGHFVIFNKIANKNEQKRSKPSSFSFSGLASTLTGCVGTSVSDFFSIGFGSGGVNFDQ